MNIEEIRANAPEGATHYLQANSFVIIYYKHGISGDWSFYRWCDGLTDWFKLKSMPVGWNDRYKPL